MGTKNRIPVRSLGSTELPLSQANEMRLQGIMVVVSQSTIRKKMAAVHFTTIPC